MLSIRKNKTETVSVPMESDEWYIIDNFELEAKIMRGFPNIDFVLDESGNVIDINYTVPPPLSPAEKIAELEAQNQMLTDCILEMSEIVYGGDL